MKLSAKEVLDELFEDIEFNESFYKVLIKNNIEFITQTQEHKNLFGGKLLGCYLIKYTYVDKDRFYENILQLDYDTVEEKLSKITTIPSNFKMARDDVNLVIFYIVHRFLTNEDLPKDKRLLYASEALNYFNYRSLILASSIFFIYPISEEKALALYERLSYKYLIKKLKNWSEYCSYRSQEYLESKFVDTVIHFREIDLQNAIYDLFSRTKDTIKNIYNEFTKLQTQNDIITTKRGTIIDVEGKEVIIDKLDIASKYYQEVLLQLTDESVFIKKELVSVVASLIDLISVKQLTETLQYLHEYYTSSKSATEEVYGFVEQVFIETIKYLNKNKVYLNNNTNLAQIMNYIVGNVLYARGVDLNINKVKSKSEEIVKKVYKFKSLHLSDRALKGLKNALILYILLRGLSNI